MEKDTIRTVVMEQAERRPEKKTEKNISRDILKDFVSKKSGSHAVVITGIRRCGKSTLLAALKEKHGAEAGYSLSFEDERLLEFRTEDFNKLFEVFLENFGERNTFFLDEIQNVRGWESFVRRQQDAGYKFYITGSNASLLSREMGTKLTGRNLKLELYPFSFSEYLRFIGTEQGHSVPHTTKAKAGMKRHFDRWLKQGGMPEYLKYDDTSMLKHVYDDIIFRDIAARYGIKQVKALRELALFFVSNIGGVFTYNSAAKFLGLGSMNTVKNYADYMENSYLIFLVPKFSYSLKKQFLSEKKIYCIDNGIADSVSFKFSENKGRYLENAVFVELKRRGGEIFYYKTKKDLETDFLVRRGRETPELIQVCFDMSADDTRQREIGALEESMKELGVKKGIIVTDDHKEKIKTKAGTIEAVRAYEWFLGY